MSFFDDLDRRHRQPALKRIEPMTASQDCPDPKCRGRMRIKFCTDCEAQPVAACHCPFLRLACDGCGWVQGNVS